LASPKNSLDFLNLLKKSEPLGLLASLSLVIAAFTYQPQELHKIYNFSVTSSFMFLLSFLFSIGYQWAKTVKLVERYEGKDSVIPLFYLLLRFGTYFFLGFGILLMLLVMSEFAKFQSSIVAIINSCLILFFGFLVIRIIFNLIKNRTSNKKPLTIDLINLVSCIAIILFSSLQIALILEALFDLSGIHKFLFTFFIYIVMPILLIPFIGHFVHQIIQEIRKRGIPKISRQHKGVNKPIFLPKQSYRYRNIFLIVNIVVVISFTSILIYFLISPEFSTSISHINLNITSVEHGSNSVTEKKNNYLNETGNNTTMPKTEPFSKFI
jgi:hypothetical protein